MKSGARALPAAVEQWIAGARDRLAAGELSLGYLEVLREIVASHGTGRRQALLYLHAREPSPAAQVIGWARHPGEDPGGIPTERPYATVVEALADGWRCLHFPQQLAPFDDREIDMVGYEFILERLEPAGGSG